MKILVTGAAGMLADEVIRVALKGGNEVIQTDINQRLPDIGALDVADRESVMKAVAAKDLDYVFHFAAETDVDLCEKQPDHAFRVNRLGTGNVVLACREYGVKLLYISTGAVFDGKKEDPYTEFDTPAPVNVYGKSKLEGEEIVRNTLSEYFILRAGWMVGGWELDKKFVYKIVRQLKEGKKKILAVSDKFGTPSFTSDFAGNLMDVLNTEKYGLYHMVNKGTCSRYDMAVKIVDSMGLRETVKVEPVGSEMFPLPAPRARSEMLCNYKLDLIGMNVMPFWEDSLEKYIRENAG